MFDWETFLKIQTGWGLNKRIGLLSSLSRYIIEREREQRESRERAERERCTGLTPFYGAKAGGRRQVADQPNSRVWFSILKYIVFEAYPMLAPKCRVGAVAGAACGSRESSSLIRIVADEAMKLIP